MSEGKVKYPNQLIKYTFAPKSLNGYIVQSTLILGIIVNESELLIRRLFRNTETEK